MQLALRESAGGRVERRVRAHAGSPSTLRNARHCSSVSTAIAHHWSSPAHGKASCGAATAIIVAGAARALARDL